MKRLLGLVPVFALAIAAAMPVQAAAPPGPYFNGFEKNLDGWFDLSSGRSGHIVREQSGYTNGGYADGIQSAAGHWHARLHGDPCLTPPNQDCAGPNTNWGGYSATFPDGGYVTQVDIYLDVNWAMNNPDVRFDWSSAINDNAGNFRRDWVFNVGTELLTQPAHFIIQTSTNAFRSGANPNAPCPNPATPPNTCRPPVLISTSGWYTFRHTFHDDGSGFLQVDFDIFATGSGANVLHQTIDSNPDDPMSTVGGNRYGWFANEEIPDLAIDNSLRTGRCHTSEGDGDVNGKDSGSAHFHHNARQCVGQEQDEQGDVEHSDPGSNVDFKSTSITAETFTFEEGSQTLTMVGTGTDDGLPVGFTMVAVDNNGALPSVYSLTLTDGYVVTGNLIDGALQVQ